MSLKSDWKLESWGFQPAAESLAAEPETGRPAVSFVNNAGLRVQVTYDRRGEMVSVCFSGKGLTAAGLPHVANLASDGRQTISDFVVAYAASRPAEVQKQEAEMRQLHAQLGEKGDSVGIPKHLLAGWPMEDMVEGFAPPARPGRAAHSDTFLAAQAKTYVQRCVKGGEKVGAVARDLGIKGGQATFSGQLRVARERGLLTGSPRRGAVEGELTPKAERLLSASAPTTGGTDGNHQAP